MPSGTSMLHSQHKGNRPSPTATKRHLTAKQKALSCHLTTKGYESRKEHTMRYAIALNDTTTAYATAEQAAVLDALKGAHSGFASLKGYATTTGYEKDAPKVADMTINLKVKPETVNKNRLEALEAITLEDVNLDKWIPSKGKDSFDNAAEQFAFCKAKLIESAKGNGSASHKKAHDDHSVYVGTGIKVWLNDDADDKGNRSIKSVLVYGLPVASKVIEKGNRKVVNSGSKVLMDCAIKALWNKRSTAIKSYNPLKAKSVQAGNLDMQSN